jgi:hypothetical protein
MDRHEAPERLEVAPHCCVSELKPAYGFRFARLPAPSRSENVAVPFSGGDSIDTIVEKVLLPTRAERLTIWPVG